MAAIGFDFNKFKVDRQNRNSFRVIPESIGRVALKVLYMEKINETELSNIEIDDLYWILEMFCPEGESEEDQNFSMLESLVSIEEARISCCRHKGKIFSSTDDFI